MSIPDHKERYVLTLTKDDCYRVKRHLKELGLPVNHFSVLVDEYIRMIEPTLRMCVEKKKSGEQLALFEVMEKVSCAAGRMETAEN
jgi:hypothetical protein